MVNTNFKELLIKTALCCMVSDGHIDKVEIDIIKSVCDKSSLLADLNLQDELNKLIMELNKYGKIFIQKYFDLLKQSKLSEEEELALIEIAIKTINSDETVNYSEIKFFKNIRYRLNISDEKILEKFPDFEFFIEEDIKTENFLDKITNQFFDVAQLHKFSFIDIQENLNKNLNKKA